MPTAQPPNRLVVVVPHTHWDREWYDPAARFRQRLVEAMDRLLGILERDPEFRCFLLDGQAVLADDYLEVRPDRAAQVGVLVRGGRLLVGPWYVLADELLSSGESLVRNLLLGRRRSASHGGWLPLGYSPDAFGHPASIPTLLAGFDIRHAILWRGYGGEPGQEKDLFRWVAPDGSEVLVHHLPPSGYEIGASLPAEPAALKKAWNDIEAVLAPRAAEDVLLLPAGADHHAPDPQLPAKIAALRRIAPRTEFRIGSPLDYFAALPKRPKAPRVSGELRFSCRYTWTLQGTHSTRAGLKRAVREADRLLVRWAEPQVALSAERGADRRAALWAAWREHLLNHFHDSLCGSVSDEVATEVIQRAGSVSRQARGLLVDALHDRVGQDRARARAQRKRWESTLAVVNPSPHPARRVVEATVTVFQEDVMVGRAPARRGAASRVRLPRITGPDGRVAQVQVLEEYDAYERLDSPDHYPDQDLVRAFRVALDPGEVPALGIKALRVGAKTARANAQLLPPVRAGDRRLAFADWLGVESDRDEGDTYTFEPVAGDHAVGEWSPAAKVWDGPLVAAVSREFTVGDRARGTVSSRVDAGSALVRIAIDGVNLRGNHRLRVRVRPPRAVPKGSGPLSAVADMQFGPVARPVQQYDRKQFPREWPVSAAPLHRYVSVPSAGYTVFVRGPTEYELFPDGSLAITLLRAVGDLSRDTLRARPGHAAWPMATPGAQEAGPFRAELGLAMTAASADSRPDAWAEIERLAEEFHAAPAGFMLRYGMDVPATTDGPELTGPGLSFLALKPQEHGAGVVARCVNLTSERITGAWTWPGPIKHAWLARLDETPLSELPVSRDRRQVRFMAEPRAVVTMVIE